MKRIDYTGKRYGRLTVLSRRDVLPFNSKHKRCLLTCQCDCGNVKEIQYDNLANGHTLSCGCIKKEQLRAKRNPDGVTAINQIHWYYRRNASSRGIVWDLTKEQFIKLITSPCHWCGIKFRTTTKTKHGSILNHNGVDRFYNERGYTIENCVPCCKICNMAKAALGPKEFEEWVISIYTNLFEVE